jgi:hypothetical protein
MKCPAVPKIQQFLNNTVSPFKEERQLRFFEKVLPMESQILNHIDRPAKTFFCKNMIVDTLKTGFGVKVQKYTAPADVVLKCLPVCITAENGHYM